MSITYWLTRGGSTLAGVIPRRIRHTLGAVGGGSSYLGWRAKRLVTQKNMAQVTGKRVDDVYVKHLALSSWCNYGRYASDFRYFPHLNITHIEENMLDLSENGTSWLDYLKETHQRGKGAIFASAHFGNWDIAGAIAARHATMTAVVESFSDPRLNELIQGQRRDNGMEVVAMESSMRRILRVLQQNQMVALVVDRPLSAEQGVPITFFGRTTYVPAGPAVLALKTGAAIIPGYVWYGHQQRFYLKAFAPIYPGNDCKGEQKKQEIIRLTQLIYNTVEEMVRAWPTQWYMFRQFWPTDNSESKG